MPRYPSDRESVGHSTEIGPVEAQVRKYIESLTDLSVLQLTYAEIGFNLARKLDRGAGMATAAVGRELRELLAAIAESTSNELDDLFKRFAMPSKVRDEKKS